MRRIVFLALVALFALQSSGAAVAASQARNGGISPLTYQVRIDVGDLLSALVRTPLGVMIFAHSHSERPPKIPPRDRRAHWTAAMQAVLAAPRSHVSVERGTVLSGPAMPALPPAPQKAAHAPVVSTSYAGRRLARRNAVRTAVTQTSAPDVAGTKPWWTFSSGPIPGVGGYSVNVATGNMVIQSADTDIHERGLDLALVRTYNSNLGTQRDWNSLGTSDDGAPTPGQTGNGWTTNYDTHLAQNSAGGISVFDGTGARYDFTPVSGNTCLTSPAGVHSQLCFDGGYGYWLYEPDGTTIHYYSPIVSQLPSDQTAYAGRLYMILGRNHNNTETLSYGWAVPSATNSLDLRSVTVTHSDGHTLTLYYAPNAANTQALLVGVKRPWDSGEAITYTYDASNNLQTVTLPSNGLGWNGQPNNRTYTYGYGGPGLLTWAASPRWDAGSSSGGNDGGYVIFTYDTTGRVTEVQQEGIANPAPGLGGLPSDGVGGTIQSNVAGGNINSLTVDYTYASGETQVSDSNGHAGAWHYDTQNRVTETDVWRNAATDSTYFSSYVSWDNNNDVVESTDIRGNTTDFGYDGNGNVIWVQEPQVTTSQGTGRPVARYAYDQYNNLTNYCDPYYVWTTGATTCGTGAGVANYTYDYSDSNEPNGRLVTVTSPGGYPVTVTYAPVNGVDVGLPTQVQGQGIAQSMDSNTPSRTPTISLSYDQYGNVTSYNTGSGSWNFKYDQKNRMIVASDPDDGSTAGSAQGPLQTSSYACYYDDGSIAYTETAAQHAADGVADGQSDCASGSIAGGALPPSAVTFVYDADGNLVNESHHFGCTTATSCASGVTTRWYDALDRLVEVKMPQDATDIFAYWITRYDYDLSNSNSSGIFGNLAAVQKYLPGATYSGQNRPSSYQWITTQQWTYDGLNRMHTRSYYSPNASMMSTDTWSYDGYMGDSQNQTGLLVFFTNAAGDSVQYTYDELGRVTKRVLSADNSSNLVNGTLPTDTITYDPDGRVSTYDDDETGMAAYHYDADGEIDWYTEPSGADSWMRPSGLGTVGPVSDPGVRYDYSYYLDGRLKQIATQDGSYSAQYGYRADGLLDAQNGNAQWTQASTSMQDSYSGTEAFTAAGRLLSKGETIGNPCPIGQNCGVQRQVYCSKCALGSALTVRYDQFGRNESWAIPSGSYGGFTYDLENEPTAFTTSPAGTSTATSWALAYSVRGELLQESSSNSRYGTLAAFRSADGFMYSTTVVQSSVNSKYGPMDDSGVPIYTFDTRTAALLQTYLGSGASANAKYTYDAAGRRSGNVQYDALNRILKGTHTYAYGPGTIPYEIGDFTQHSSLGVTPTFATDSAGNWQDIKFGSDAEILPQDRTFSGMTAYDRDPFGYVAVQRNSSGTSAWTVPNLYSGCDTQNAGDAAAASTGFTGTAFNSCLSNGLLYQYRTDGYYDGALTFRGVRTYDSSTQQWSTPDAYAGNPANPISSLGYNYAGNNPAMFADPSGFCSFSSNNSGLATIAQGCADGAGDLSWCVIGCYGDDPLGPDGMPADWRLLARMLNRDLRRDTQMFCSLMAADDKTVKSFNFLGTKVTNFSVIQSALFAAWAKAGSAIGGVGATLLVRGTAGAAGGAAGAVVPGADVTGVSEVAGAAEAEAAATPLATAANKFGSWIGGTAAAFFGGNLSYGALKFAQTALCGKH